MALKPQTRVEQILAGEQVDPQTRLEYFLTQLMTEIKNSGGSGSGDPTDLTQEELEKLRQDVASMVDKVSGLGTLAEATEKVIDTTTSEITVSLKDNTAYTYLADCNSVAISIPADVEFGWCCYLSFKVGDCGGDYGFKPIFQNNSEHPVVCFKNGEQVYSNYFSAYMNERILIDFDGQYIYIFQQEWDNNELENMGKATE